MVYPLSEILEDEAQDICVIETTLGLFKLLSLPQRIKTASGVFQRTEENFREGFVGTIRFQDDVKNPEKEDVIVRHIGGQLKVTCKTRDSP